MGRHNGNGHFAAYPAARSLVTQIHSGLGRPVPKRALTDATGVAHVALRRAFAAGRRAGVADDTIRAVEQVAHDRAPDAADAERAVALLDAIQAAARLPCAATVARCPELRPRERSTWCAGCQARAVLNGGGG